MLKKIREQARKIILFRKMVAYHLAPSGLFDWWFRGYRLDVNWERRTRDVVSCPDNEAIPRCEIAGKIMGGTQALHNGIKIHLGSYYGPEYAQMLQRNRGVHEPQEERVFAEVLKHLAPGAVMLELGAFWGFYSMWFNKEIEKAKNFLVEPDEFNLGQGKRNFRLNRMKGHFTQAYIGKRTETTGRAPTFCVDDLLKQNGIEKLSILHSDIQGYEYDMLEGAAHSIAEGRVDYVFISTHSNDLHNRCLQWLTDKSFRIIAAADLDNTYSEDGLIVAAAPFVSVPVKVEIAKKPATVNEGNS